MNALRQNKGFTLIEVLISFVLLAILATVTLSLFSQGFQSITKFGNRSESMHLTRKDIEQATSGTDGNLTINKVSGAGAPITIHGETVNKQITEASGSSLDLFIATPPQWAATVDYTLNDQVRYKGKNYKCLRPHTSSISNAPDIEGSYWTDI
ncbi:prepilin-type N-terminal cleavage/methylation domain-containing protein [Paenibacillus sp. N3/727]|uniref:carbohydrate-binding protein n=1 Tax=Paenibacillus sp. N3/727 TaxID=2925845 RepID=UPI001F53B233|nr:carbohydrate-binding protein [Paenibacillus sp. N3/727]UNK16089.1 prepilin-type N-terminal cleavage/methylation domain-containing protein [Paenibacillus sp. N3/727]